MTSLYVNGGYVSDFYVQTGITVYWGQRIIYIPKSETQLIQSFPFEVRQLDINYFRLQLKALEDDVNGMSFPATHSHNTEVTLSGIVYARVIEIINNYTITFEDGDYAVNLVGANSNMADKINLNKVSVRSSNSAGLITVSTNGSDPTAIANAVWAHPSSDPAIVSTAVWNHSTGTLIAVRLAEVWGRLGLDATKPLVTGNTTITFGDIVMTLAELNNEVTVTRQ